VTKGRIKALLPWLDTYYDRNFDGTRLKDAPNPQGIDMANFLRSGYFKTEREQ
jgi:hypothetical protein